MKHSKKFPTEIWFETGTIHDKKSAFRASEPPQYILKIVAKGNGNIVLREFSYPTKPQRDAQQAIIRALFEKGV